MSRTRENNNDMAMSPEGSELKIDCAGKAQQQFTRPNEWPVFNGLKHSLSFRKVKCKEAWQDTSIRATSAERG
jgi:hypothetical protein